MGLNKFAMIIALARAVSSGGGTPPGYVATAPYIADYFSKDNPGAVPALEVECNAIKNGDLIVVLCSGWANNHILMGVGDTEDGSYNDGVPYTQQQYTNTDNDTYSDSMPMHMWTRVATKNYTSLKIRTVGAYYSSMIVLIVRNVGSGVFDDGGTRATPVTSYVYDNLEVTCDNAVTTYPKDLVIAGFAWYNSNIVADMDSNWPVYIGRNDGDTSTNRLVASVKTTDTAGNYDPVCKLGTGKSSYLSAMSIVVKGKHAPAAPTITSNTPTLTASDNTTIDTLDALWASATLSQYIIINNELTTIASASTGTLYYDTAGVYANQRITIVRKGNATSEGLILSINSADSGDSYAAFIGGTNAAIRRNGSAFGNNFWVEFAYFPAANIDYTQDTTFCLESIDGVLSFYINGVKVYRQLDLTPVITGTCGIYLPSNNISLKSIAIDRWNPPVTSGGGGGPTPGALEPGVDGIFHMNEVDGTTLYQINNKFGTATDDLVITSNTLRATALWTWTARLYANAQGADQYSSLIRKGADYSSGLVILYLQATSNSVGYRIEVNTGQYTIYKDNTWAANGSFTHDWTADTAVAVKIVGGVISVYLDGVQVGSSYTDSTPSTGGYPGFTLYLGGGAATIHSISQWTDNAF